MKLRPTEFEKINITIKDLEEINKSSQITEDGIMNPFKDTLANSDILPKTIKLDV